MIICKQCKGTIKSTVLLIWRKKIVKIGTRTVKLIILNRRGINFFHNKKCLMKYLKKRGYDDSK